MKKFLLKYLIKRQEFFKSILFRPALLWIILLLGAEEAKGQQTVNFVNSAFVTVADGITTTSLTIANYDPGVSTNRFMVVAVTTSRNDVTGVTFGGDALDPIPSGNVSNGNSRVVFFIMADPPSGPANLVATVVSDNRGFAMGVATFSNVDLTNPTKAFTPSTGSSATPTITNIPTSQGSRIFSAISYRNGSRTYNGLGADQTEIWAFQSASSNDRHWSLGSRKFIPTGSSTTSTSMSYSFSNAEDFSAGAISINPILEADLGITKAVNVPQPYSGQEVIFTLTATANASAPNVVVNDLLPSGFTYVSHSTASGTYNAGAGLWTLPNPLTSTATLTITAIVNPTGSYTNTATISGDVIDSNSANNTASVTTVPCGAGGIAPLFKNN